MWRGVGMTLLLLNLTCCPSLAFVSIARKAVVVHRRNFRSSTAVSLNRFLFDPTEVDFSDDGVATVTIPKDDYRTIHASKTLGLRNGDTIRAGIVSDPNQKDNQDDRSSGSTGLVTDTATIQWLPEGKVKKAEPLGNGNPPGSLYILLNSLQDPASMTSLAPVSLILALPRPLQLGRILPMISQMGVSPSTDSKPRPVNPLPLIVIATLTYSTGRPFGPLRSPESSQRLFRIPPLSVPRTAPGTSH